MTTPKLKEGSIELTDWNFNVGDLVTSAIREAFEDDPLYVAISHVPRSAPLTLLISLPLGEALFFEIPLRDVVLEFVDDGDEEDRAAMIAAMRSLADEMESKSVGDAP